MTWLGPLLWLQGRYVRRRILKLPEPPGPRSGTEGSGPAVGLLIAGDSAAAGVGAPTQGAALSGRLVGELARSYRVKWSLEAKTGATTASTLRWLSKLNGSTFDVFVTSLGVNDVTGRVGLQEWLSQQRELRDLARSRFGARLLVISGLPPVGRFPALPKPLRGYLGRRATEFSQALQAELMAERTARFLDLRFTLDPALMAEDGFHPGPRIYEGWAERAATMIREGREHHSEAVPMADPSAARKGPPA